MIKFWKKSLPFTCGLILSICCVLFFIEFIRNIDFEDWEYTLEVMPYFAVGLLLGLVGIPLAVFGIGKLTDENS